MFTGLIEDMGRVEALTRKGRDAVLRIRAGIDLSQSRIGDSIAVSGACLTITALKGNTFQADVSAETLSQTNLGRLKPGDRVNLERAMRLGDRLGGHLISGHVDSQAVLISKDKEGDSIRLKYRLGPEVLRYVIAKGSIAVEGVSLTVNQVGPDFFEVNIIPHTADKTTLGLNKTGEMVNIETDLIGKYVERLISPYKKDNQGLTPELLARHGFLEREEGF
ncbi:MAG: riboflavin synthase [Deltaproteobacteria bacterium]|nr:riboflavin synthase [Deltaproteobacteria bacterium]